MATLVRWQVDDPQDILDTYGAGAVSRIERGTTSAMTDAAEITTVAVVATTTEHEYKDATGAAGTHWYRLRFSTATPSVSTDYSGYGPVFQAGSPGGEVLALETVKTWQTLTDAVDDPWLPIAIGAINRSAIRMIGVDIGPSPDTTRTYDACDAVRDGRRLWIPGGIRSFTTVEVSYDGTTWVDVTAYLRIGPASQARAAGEPGAYIEFLPYLSGNVASFAGYHYVRITGTAFQTFGWDAYPMDLVQTCAAALQRLYADRQGRGAFPTETDAARYFNPATLAYFRRLYFADVA